MILYLPMLLGNLSVDLEELPQLEETPHQGHPIAFRRELLVLTSLPFILLLAGPVTLLILGNLIWAAVSMAVWAILFGFTLLVILKSFPVRGYALRNLDISYKKGWIFFSHITIPFARVQHSEISQGPVDRYFGLVSLQIYTAGGSSSDLKIPGLPRDEAERLRDYISQYHD